MTGRIQHNQAQTNKGRIAVQGTVAAIGATLMFALAGCGGSGDNQAGFAGNGSSSGTTDLTGTWELSGLSASGKSVTCPFGANPTGTQNVLTVNDVEADRCFVGENIAFSGSTYTITYPAPRYLNLAVESGSYSVNGGTITLSRSSRSYDTNNDGVITPSETSSVSPAQKVSGSLTVQNGVLTFTPQTADNAVDIARAVDGTPVSRSYSKRLL